VGAGLWLSQGCPQSTVNNPDGGSVGGFTECSGNSECPIGFMCHRELRRCVCTNDSSCPPGLYCNAFSGQCVTDVPGCTSDGQCAASEYCETSTRTCRKLHAFCEPCKADVECGGAADRCLLDEQLSRTFCGKACATDADCDKGSSCQDKGGAMSCWPTNSNCESLAGCNPDTSQACTQDADCSEGTDQVCDQVQQSCVARVPTCPFGQVCDRNSKTCTAACTTDDECNLNPDCENTPCRCTNNQCIPISICKDNNECATGKICVIEPGQTQGECGASCVADIDCPQGSVCTDLGSRKACMPGCTSSADCSLAQNCSGGRCVTGCQTSDVCAICQQCVPVNAQVSECRGIGATYCQTCALLPTQDNFCVTVSGTQNCCDMDQSFGVIKGMLGQDCSVRPCPSGFDCYGIVSGTVTSAYNCFPSGNTCSSPTCN